MNILFISPNSPFESIGGIERYIINLINYYKVKSDSKAYLLLPTTSENHSEIEGNMTIYYDNNFSIPRKKKSQELIAKKAENFAKNIEEIIKKHDINVICAENILFGPPAVYSIRLNMIALKFRIPLMLRLHVYASSALQIELTNQLMWDKISCVSKSVAGDCFQKGTDVNKLSTDYLGVNANYFYINPSLNNNLKNELNLDKDTKIILTAARIITGTKIMLKEKGIINLIQAFSKIAKRYPKSRLLIAVGRASADLQNEFDASFEMLEGYIKIHNIKDQTIVKIFELDQMPNVYRGSDMFVLPAEMNETFGQTFIEAMACGTPVIGANTGGIPEIISDGYNGYLVQPDDSSVLAQKIEKLLNDNKIKDKFIKAGIKTVNEKFTSEKQFSSFNEMLEETIANIL